MIQKTALRVIKNKKGVVLALIISSILQSFSIVGQAWFFAILINNLIFLDHTLIDESNTIIYLAVFILFRLAFSYLQEYLSSSLGDSVKSILRKEALTHLFKLGIQQKESQGDTIHLITDGLEQVEAYVSIYIPQMIYAIIIPLVMGIAIMDTLPIIGAILIGTVPLIPLFMILIGKQAEKMNQEQWERMSLLSGHFLDVLRGITTLKVFGRAKEQIQVISRLSNEFKDSTLRVLRVAFLSALVLELVSTISTAIIAVYLGLTLLDGGLDFLSAFFMLLLAPEFYTPFRQLGAAFHTGMSGKTALAKFDAFMNISTALPRGGNCRIQGIIESIRLDNLNYTYPETSNGIKHITLQVYRNKPIMLVGESGAGKSTIARILGAFLAAPPNSVYVNDIDLSTYSMDWWRTQVTYVSQKPHVMHGTLRDNIAFGQDVSDDELLEAAKLAELHDVICEKGLDFVVGEGGMGLSGGELQRIALARAFLHRGQVLILDEVTSHLDVNTEAQISRALQRLMKDKTVILVGHRIQTMQWASQLYVLRQGEIIEQGTYESLLAQNGYFKALVDAGTGSFVMSDEDVSYVSKLEVPLPQQQEALSNSKVPYEADKTKYSDIEGWKLLFSVLKPARWSLVLALVFTSLTVFMNVGLLSVSSWLLASAALQPGITYLSLAIVGVRFFGISRAVCRYFERYTSHKMAFQGLYGLRVWFYTYLEPLAPAIFKRWGAGDMLNRIMADIEVLQFFYLRTLIPPVAAIALTILVSFGVGTIDTNLSTLVWCAALMTGVVLPYGIYRYHRTSLNMISQVQGHFKSTLTDTLESLEDIISYHNENLVMERMMQSIDDVEYHKGRISKGMNLGNTMFIAIVQIVVVLAALLASNVLTGPWASVMVVVCAIGIQAWFEALQPMIVSFHHGYESLVAVRRLLQIKHAPLPIKDTGCVDLDSMDTISLKHVNFGYDHSSLIYKDLTLDIPKGQAVAIVGASGSGKTTLFSLLERLYDYSGHISVGYNDLKTVTIDSWRNLMGSITQDTYIFHATLEDNIRLAKPHASADEVQRAVEQAVLSDVVTRLPKGLRTIVGSGGVGLSGGERQRVALARLFLRNPELILLDEPLEGLDQVTRRKLHNDILAFTKGKTVLYITHQLEGLELMDRILFMEKGCIVEDGTFSELIAKKGRFYAYCRLTMASV